MRILKFSGASLINGCVMTIGNFDGLHLGHQQMLKNLITAGVDKNLPTAAVIFEPQPLEYFKYKELPARLMTFRQKVEAIKDIGTDIVVCLTFNEMLAKKSANEFIEVVLCEKLKARYIQVGHDFKFGRNRSGDVQTLKALENKFGFETSICKLIEFDGIKISSTRVRTSLKDGNLSTAAQMLGRYYQINGRVMHGAKRGRLIGVPTANIKLKYLPLALCGVYSVEVKIDNQNNLYKGVANVGFRPTVGGTSPQLEVHIFNFSGDLYGKRLVTYFIKKIRKEIKFESFNDLTTQINKDIVTAHQHFGINPE